jgi:hypothetical protein
MFFIVFFATNHIGGLKYQTSWTLSIVLIQLKHDVSETGVCLRPPEIGRWVYNSQKLSAHIKEILLLALLQMELILFFAAK